MEELHLQQNVLRGKIYVEKTKEQFMQEMAQKEEESRRVKEENNAT